MLRIFADAQKVDRSVHAIRLAAACECRHPCRRSFSALPMPSAIADNSDVINSDPWPDGNRNTVRYCNDNTDRDTYANTNGEYNARSNAHSELDS